MSDSKQFDSFREAVADIPDGVTIAFSGFSEIGLPFNLINALVEQGARDLTCVSNTTGSSGEGRLPDIGMLVERRRVRKVICAFTAPSRPSETLPFTKFYEAGEVEGELVPMGTLAERLRAAGAGIPAFYTRTGVGTDLAKGRETREFSGKEYLLEEALPVDYAFLRAYRADMFGNLQFRRAQRNFNPIMAMAARTTVVEVEDAIVPVGAMDADHIHTSGIFVDRLVLIPPSPNGFWPKGWRQ